MHLDLFVLGHLLTPTHRCFSLHRTPVGLTGACRAYEVLHGPSDQV